MDTIMDIVIARDPFEKEFHQSCLSASEEYGTPGNYVNGANIAGFIKVADSMMDQGIV